MHVKENLIQTFDYNDCNLVDWHEFWRINTGQNSLEDQNVRYGIQNSERWCKDDRFCKVKKEIQNQDVAISCTFHNWSNPVQF